MNKLLMWWMSLRAAKGDAVHWQREAEKWERKYEAAIAVRDQLSQQLEETQAALIKVMGLQKTHDEAIPTMMISEGISLKREFFGMPVVIDSTLPPGTIEFCGADGSVIRRVNILVED